jgi:1-acyl-sn-glycerol-3-phosphate acyltransferase
VQNIPIDKPVLFLANHQNALIDPLLIATKSGRFSYFLTRASVFKKPIISKLLHSLQMLPVYRIRDGWSKLSNNNSIFSTCVEQLHKKKAITIFPEGSHHINRTVRPLSKGFTRIVFETLETHPECDLQLVPVGINFKKSEDFVDSTAVYFGQPIAAMDYILKDRSEAVVALKKDVEKAISELTTHIPAENYAETLKRLEGYNPDFLNPVATNKCIASNFEDCPTHSKPRKNVLKPLIKYLLLLNFLPPFLIWRTLVKPRIKEIEFMATFRFAIYITLFPIWFFVIVLALGFLFGWQLTACYALLVTVLAFYYVKS